MPYAMFVVCELASAGYGTPATLLNTRCDIILSAYDYLKSMQEYEERFHQLNEPKEHK